MSIIERDKQVGNQYSQITVHGDTVYLAGLVARDAKADFPRQTQDIFDQIDTLLETAGTNRSRLLSVQVFITDFSNYDEFKVLYGGWIDPENLPSRATVGAELLAADLKIEIMCVAAR